MSHDLGGRNELGRVLKFKKIQADYRTVIGGIKSTSNYGNCKSVSSLTNTAFIKGANGVVLRRTSTSLSGAGCKNLGLQGSLRRLTPNQDGGYTDQTYLTVALMKKLWVVRETVRTVYQSAS